MGNNLLPPTQKEELQNEIKSKKIAFILILILSAVIFFVAIILSLYFYANNEINAINERIFLTQQNLEKPQLQEIKSQIEIANQNLSKISAIKKEQVSVVSVLEKLLQDVPSKIFLKNFLFQNSFKDIENPETKTIDRIFFAKIKLNGLAQDRETLLFFKKSLDQEKEFQEVYFDPISWVKSKNAEFSTEFNFFSNYNVIQTKN